MTESNRCYMANSTGRVPYVFEERDVAVDADAGEAENSPDTDGEATSNLLDSCLKIFRVHMTFHLFIRTSEIRIESLLPS